MLSIHRDVSRLDRPLAWSIMTTHTLQWKQNKSLHKQEHCWRPAIYRLWPTSLNFTSQHHQKYLQLLQPQLHNNISPHFLLHLQIHFPLPREQTYQHLHLPMWSPGTSQPGDTIQWSSMGWGTTSVLGWPDSWWDKPNTHQIHAASLAFICLVYRCWKVFWLCFLFFFNKQGLSNLPSLASFNQI